jgi:hypothetical protein
MIFRMTMMYDLPVFGLAVISYFCMAFHVLTRPFRFILTDSLGSNYGFVCHGKLIRS